MAGGLAAVAALPVVALRCRTRSLRSRLRSCSTFGWRQPAIERDVSALHHVEQRACAGAFGVVERLFELALLDQQIDQAVIRRDVRFEKLLTLDRRARHLFAQRFDLLDRGLERAARVRWPSESGVRQSGNMRR